MDTTKQIAKLLRDVHFGGNWTWVNLKDTLDGVTWQQATEKVHSFNTIAALVYHMNYYVHGVSKFLQGEPLSTKDKFSFEHPPINSEEEWQRLIQTVWNDVENFSELIENLPDEKLEEIFVGEEYGNYYRNLHGIIEHCHYHLGQIVLIKKILNEKDTQ